MKSAESIFVVLVPLLLAGSVACGPAFSAGEPIADAGGAAGDAASLGGAAGGLAMAGRAGAPAGGAAGSEAALGGLGGMPQAGSDSGGGGSVAGAPDSGAPPCADAVSVSGGYYSIGRDRCLRTTETFDTITCANWGSTIIRVNGAQAACNKQGAFPPPIDGYNYFELVGTGPTAGQLRWLTLHAVVPCKDPVTLPSTMKSVMLAAPALCIRTSSDFNAISGVGMEDRTVRINGVAVPNNTQVGFPPSTDGYNYIDVSAGSDPNARLSWSHVTIAQG